MLPFPQTRIVEIITIENSPTTVTELYYLGVSLSVLEGREGERVGLDIYLSFTQSPKALPFPSPSNTDKGRRTLNINY